MPGDSFFISRVIPPPLEGIWDGLDPTLSDALYPATRAADLSNVRVASGKWAARQGISLSLTAPGSGAIRLFDVLYTESGGRFRLLARGDDSNAVFYDLEVGVDTNFVATSGGTGLGTTTSSQPYFHGSVLNDKYYFTDRSGSLRRYDTSGTVATVTQPSAPSQAPRTTAWTYQKLESWAGTAPFGWTESDPADFNVTAGGTYDGIPMGTNYVKIHISGSAAKNDTISKNVTNEPLNSHQIAFFYNTAASLKKHIQFGFGNQGPDEFVEIIWAPSKEEWYPIFINVGNLPSINYKRFKAIRARTSQDFYITELFLPGRLEGLYRWVYTHYDPSTGRESSTSPISNNGEALDFSAVGISLNTGQAAAKAFQKSCMLDFTSDNATDSSTTRIRVYRSGGLPELTQDATGRTLWFRVAEIVDFTTTLSGAHSAGATTLTLATTSGLAAGDYLVIAKGDATQEYVQVASVVSGTQITIKSGLLFNQAAGESVDIAYLDNVPNEAINVLDVVDEERDGPPQGAHWVQRSPDGRLWIFRYSGKPTGIAVSNRATPDRPTDYEVFPANVDPITRQNPLQGWRFEIGGDTTGEEIMWGGFFHGLPTVLTRNKLYRIHALAQTDWGPNAIQKVLDVGCIAGDTVQSQDGWLYWVSEGPRVVRWDGASATVENLSHQRVQDRLAGFSQTNAIRWFARTWENELGKYYSLFYDHGNTHRLDYNITQNAWEESSWKDSAGITHGWQAARVFDGSTDTNALYQMNWRGQMFQSDFSGTNDDNGVAISFLLKTKRFDLGGIGELREVYIRYTSSASDTVTLTVTTGGSDYGVVSKSYTLTLNSSTDDELRQYVERELRGRWVEFTISGDVKGAPKIREIEFIWHPVRTFKSTSD